MPAPRCGRDLCLQFGQPDRPGRSRLLERGFASRKSKRHLAVPLLKGSHGAQSAKAVTGRKISPGPGSSNKARGYFAGAGRTVKRLRGYGRPVQTGPVRRSSAKSVSSLPLPDIGARPDSGAALANQYATGPHLLRAVALHTEPLPGTVATILTATAALLVCHMSNSFLIPGFLFQKLENQN